jgi:thiamine biosynthesis lipoprotein
MKKIIFLLGLVFILLSACQDIKYYKINGEAQGTTYHIIYNKDKMLKNEIDSILNEIDLSVSTYNTNSILYKINHNYLDVDLDNHFIAIFKKSMEITKNSEGFFDITVGPLVNLYGFGTEKKGEITQEQIDSLLEFVGFEKVKIEKNKVVKTVPGIVLDMNALAQGYSVDYVADYLERNGIFNYLVEVGGETICRGKNEFGDAWRIGVEKPITTFDYDNRQIEIIVAFKDEKKALATSGNYRKYYVEDGVKFTHSINPFTGYTTKDSLVSATIMADDCMSADGYATACMVSGYEKALKIINNNEKLEGFLIYIDFKGEYQFYFSEGFKKYLTE